MRPVEKKPADGKNSIILFEDVADMKSREEIIQADYRQYGKARKVLVANLGSYCSYCENYFSQSGNLQTEHIQPKSKYPELETRWDNFLLACPTCNGKGNKGEKDVILDEVHLPHRNNTFLSLIYKEAGVVEVNSALSELSRQHAQKLVDLVGLDKSDTETDQRRDMRRKAWNDAQSCLKLYESKKIVLKRLINYIKTRDCWSIWFTVFEGYDEVRKALIDEFPGTAKECFDANNHYEPIERNPGKPDPV